MACALRLALGKEGIEIVTASSPAGALATATAVSNADVRRIFSHQRVEKAATDRRHRL